MGSGRRPSRSPRERRAATITNALRRTHKPPPDAYRAPSAASEPPAAPARSLRSGRRARPDHEHPAAARRAPAPLSVRPRPRARATAPAPRRDGGRQARRRDGAAAQGRRRRRQEGGRQEGGQEGRGQGRRAERRGRADHDLLRRDALLGARARARGRDQGARQARERRRGRQGERHRPRAPLALGPRDRQADDAGGAPAAGAFVVVLWGGWCRVGVAAGWGAALFLAPRSDRALSSSSPRSKPSL